VSIVSAHISYFDPFKYNMLQQKLAFYFDCINCYYFSAKLCSFHEDKQHRFCGIKACEVGLEKEWKLIFAILREHTLPVEQIANGSSN